MKSISAFLLVLLAVCVLSQPTNKQKSIPKSEEWEEKSTVTIVHPTVKCEHVHFLKEKESEKRGIMDEHGACFSHCVTLGSEYRDGKCERGYCQCKLEVPHSGNTNRVQTVNCVDLEPEEGGANSENDEACEVHCKSLGQNFREGKCVAEICTCRVL